MDIPSLTTAMASLKFAKDAVETALSVRDFNSAAAALAGVNDQLLKAQEGLFVYSARLAELQDKLGQCQEELRQLKRVQSERDQYSLFQVADGIWVYRSNMAAQPDEGRTQFTETAHYLCQPCFDKNVKSVLQADLRYAGRALVCTVCQARLRV
ncbi:hypothetical protein [Xanthomonas prunicola]|uniref:Uncharacterized protein n=1 Tax=Xanthomonas prunicola TaxID=2053930 RepID=A0A9Q9MS47_9XANT|nr:hypothetical protein [Xanthomonas prunicola]UXA66043.1 hypothetical protein M0D43_03080 [Xanthomonas prunicola]